MSRPNHHPSFDTVPGHFILSSPPTLDFLAAHARKQRAEYD